MATERSSTARTTDPLVAIFVEEAGEDVVRSVLEDVADATAPDDATRAALAAIGSCSDLDWQRWADELDRIRHESPPPPPIECDDLCGSTWLTPSSPVPNDATGCAPGVS